MKKLSEIYNIIDEVAPFSSALGFDNAGINVGDKNREITKVLICLDITKTVIDEAVKIGAELIISHHPVIFDPVKNINSNSVLYYLIQKDICAIGLHTNFDLCDTIGVNIALGETVGLKNITRVDDYYTATIDETTPKDFALHVKKSLNATVGYNETGRNITKIAMCSGSGGSLVYEVEDADAVLCGEAKHSDYIEAVNRNICLVTAGHYQTEKVYDTYLQKYLKEKIEDVEFFVSKDEKPACNYI